MEISSDDKMKIFTKGFWKQMDSGHYISWEIPPITSHAIIENERSGTGPQFETKVPECTYCFASDNSGGEP